MTATNNNIIPEAPRKTWPHRYPVQCLALAMAYFLLATLCIFITHSTSQHIAFVWWPNALVLAVLLRTPPRRWWGFATASIGANIAANLVMGYHPLLSPALAISDMVEIGLSLWFLRGGNRQWRPMHSVREFVFSMALILGVGAGVSSVLATVAMHTLAGASINDIWRTWWMAECVGMVSLLPIALTASKDSLKQLFLGQRRQELFGIGAVSLGITFIALQQMPFPLIVVTVPLLIAALRLGTLGTAMVGTANVLLILLLVLARPYQFDSDILLLARHSLLMATTLLLTGPMMVAILVEQRGRTLMHLSESERVFRDSMRYAPIGMMLIDANGFCLRSNPAAARFLGYSETELMGMHMRQLAPSDEIQQIASVLRRVMLGEQESASIERRYIRKDGAIVWAHLSVAAARNERNEFLYFISQLEDIETRKQEERRREELQRELEHRARHDNLTGLINRSAFEDSIDELLSAHGDRQHSLCFIDLDRFKILNDSAGHSAGDVLLRQIAQRLRQRVRSHDVLARLSGDEFGLLLPDCGGADAQRIAAQLIETINAIQFSWEGRYFSVGASIGIVPFNAGSLSLSELMSRADVACYSAKKEGRNRVSIYDDGDSIAARNHHQIQMAASIREALEAGRFCLYAQQIEALNPAIKTRPMEILVRLRTRDGQLLAPGAFIPAAERFDLMAAIDRWVIRNALIEHGDELASLDNVSICINLSGNSFNDPDFAEYLREMIHDTPIRHAQICFELTETAVVNNIGQAARLLHILREEGCKVALDDFGNGLSSFSYLKNFPADIVKIDGGFVRSLCENDLDRAIVESINQIAHRIGALTVAEFVETAEIAHQLRELGVDFAQGYHIARPEPLTSALQRLTFPQTVAASAG